MRCALTVEGPFAAALRGEADNLVLRAARSLAAAAGIARGAAITLTKNLPVASGIGGGSADAAAALRALCRLWNVAPDAVPLDAIAQQLGADVPVCLDRRRVASSAASASSACQPGPAAGRRRPRQSAHRALDPRRL